MASFPNIWRPRPGRFGNAVEVISQSLGTQGVTVANGTVVLVPSPRRRFYIESIHILGTVAATATSATFKVQRRDSAGAADVDLTAATSLTSSVITGANTNAAVAISATQKQRQCNPGDLLKIVLATNTLTVQPTCQICIEIGFLD